jgi:hypothetical protein
VIDRGGRRRKTIEHYQLVTMSTGGGLVVLVDIVVVFGGFLSHPAGQQAQGGAHRTSCVGLLFLLCKISGMLFQIFGEVVSVRDPGARSSSYQSFVLSVPS